MINSKYDRLTLIQISVNYCKYFVTFLDFSNFQGVSIFFRVFLSVKYFAQHCKSDPVGFLNPETLIFPMVSNMSLCTYFPCRLQNQQNSTGFLGDHIRLELQNQNFSVSTRVEITRFAQHLARTKLKHLTKNYDLQPCAKYFGSK